MSVRIGFSVWLASSYALVFDDNFSVVVATLGLANSVAGFARGGVPASASLSHPSSAGRCPPRLRRPARSTAPAAVCMVIRAVSTKRRVPPRSIATGIASSRSAAARWRCCHRRCCCCCCCLRILLCKEMMTATFEAPATAYIISQRRSPTR